MISVFWKLVKSGKKAFDYLDSKINFSIPENLVVYMGLQGKMDDRNLKINKNNFRLQIWKMQKDQETIYTKEILLPAIEYIIKKTWKNEKIIIQLWPDLARFLTNDDKKEELEQILSFEEEKQIIIKLIKRYFKKDIGKFEIKNISNQYPELFSLLKEKWKDGLYSSEKPILNKHNFWPLTIAKFLYWNSQNNPKLLRLFYNTKTDQQKVKDTLDVWKNQSDYYSLVEVAVRLYEIVSWIYIQWWIDRQSKYDKIIGGIIQRKDIDTFKTKDCPELKELNLIGKQIQYEMRFDRVYINTKGARQTNEKKQIQSNIKNAINIGVGIGIWASVILSWNQYIKIQTQKKATQETIKEIFENKKVCRTWDMWAWEYVGDEKIEAINTYVGSIYNRFIFRYWGIWKFTETEFKSKIIDCLNDQKVLDLLWQYRGCDNMVTEDKVIDEYLIPRNIWEFKTSWVDVVPYSKYLEYTDEFINTILLEEDRETNRDASTKMDWVRWHSFNYSLVDEIWSYWPKEQWYYASIIYLYQLAKVKRWWKFYILATSSPHYKDFKKSENYELSTMRWRELAIDFLKQTYPVINEVLDQYLLRYYERYSNSWDLNWPYKKTLPGDIQLMILRDFLSKWLLKKIDKKEIDKIISYLDMFVIQNQNKLKNIQSSISPDLMPVNPSLIPNGILEEYEQAMTNTIQDQERVLNKNAWLPVSRLNQDNLEKIVEPLWRYRAQDGKMYLIGKVKIEWKEYLYAEEEWRLSYKDRTEYWIYYGEIVAKDYFKTKSKFLQKKLLYEKKLKSASQRHRDISPSWDTYAGNSYFKNNFKWPVVSQ